MHRWLAAPDGARRMRAMRLFSESPIRPEGEVFVAADCGGGDGGGA